MKFTHFRDAGVFFAEALVLYQALHRLVLLQLDINGLGNMRYLRGRGA